MSPLNGIDGVLISTTVNLLTIGLTWLVLWAAGTASVHLWCAGGLATTAFSYLVAARALGWEIPDATFLLVTGVLGPAGMLCRSLAVWQLVGRVIRWRTIGAVAGAFVAVLAVLELAGVEERWVSTLIYAGTAAPLLPAAISALHAHRVLQLRFAAALAAALFTGFVVASLLLLGIALGGMNPGDLSKDPVPLYASVLPSLPAFVMNALFIGVVMDLMQRRLARLESVRTRWDERERLLADMHDGFGSTLAIARLKLANARMDQQSLLGVVGDALDDLRLTVDTLQDTSDSLEAALGNYRERIARRLEDTGIDLRWDLRLDGVPALPERARLQLLRIVQEALNNAVRHGRPRTIRIAVRADVAPDGALEVEVTDDGRGLPPDAAPGRGIPNMHRRAQSIGATLELVARHGGGTRVTLRVPPAAAAALPTMPGT